VSPAVTSWSGTSLPHRHRTGRAEARGGRPDEPVRGARRRRAVRPAVSPLRPRGAVDAHPGDRPDVLLHPRRSHWRAAHRHAQTWSICAQSSSGLSIPRAVRNRRSARVLDSQMAPTRLSCGRCFGKWSL